MGRELRRVPLTFDWPLNKVWHGFLNPHGGPCPNEEKGLCHGGYSNAGKWLDAICRLIAMVGDEAACSGQECQAHFAKTGRSYPHPYLQEWEQAPRTEVPHDVHERLRSIDSQEDRFRELRRHLARNPPRLLPLDGELASLVKGLAGGRDLGPFGGSTISYEIGRALIKAAGISEDDQWGTCKVCGGHGDDPKKRAEAEAWEPTPPPDGDGYQLWETVSEGSPVSAVYPTKEAFIKYLIGEGYSETAARNFCEAGWAPSGVMVVGGPDANEDGSQRMYHYIEAAEIMGGETAPSA
jgi:hypothetical protein